MNLTLDIKNIQNISDIEIIPILYENNILIEKPDYIKIVDRNINLYDKKYYMALGWQYLEDNFPQENITEEDNKIQEYTKFIYELRNKIFKIHYEYFKDNYKKYDQLLSNINITKDEFIAKGIYHTTKDIMWEYDESKDLMQLYIEIDIENDNNINEIKFIKPNIFFNISPIDEYKKQLIYIKWII